MNYNLNSGYGMQLAHLLPQGFAGKVFMVAKSAAAGRDMLQQIFVPDSDGINRYAATIDAAIGYTTAGRGDLILVAPDHTESVTAAAGIALDVAGVSVIGLGSGNNRPVITFSSATTASFDITAANCVVKNIVGVAGIDGLTKPFLVSGDNCVVDVEWQDASSTVEAETVVRLDTANNSILNLKYLGFTAGNAAVRVVAVDDCDNVRINIDAYGVVSTAWVNFVDAASTNVVVNGTLYTQGITNFTRDVVDTVTGSTWSATIFDASAGYLVSGGSASALAADDVSAIASQVTTIKGDVGGVDSATNVLGADDADNQFASTNVAANEDGSILERLEQLQEAVNKGSGTALAANKSLVDALGTDGTTVSDTAVGIAGMIGVNDADNAFSSSSVVANVDGSVLERLEALMDPLSGYDPVLGWKVTKVSDMADGAGTDNLFTVTGRCLITSLTGEVTTVIGTTTTMKLTDTTNSVDLCAATTITSDAVGTMYALGGVKADVLNGGIAPVVGSISFANGSFTPVIVGDVQAPLTIAHVLDGAGTGAVTWTLFYKPLVASATVAAAA